MEGQQVPRVGDLRRADLCGGQVADLAGDPAVRHAPHAAVVDHDGDPVFGYAHVQLNALAAVIHGRLKRVDRVFRRGLHQPAVGEAHGAEA